MRKSLDAWLSDLEGLHPSAIDLGLARCAEVARCLDLLAPNSITITVAGTNGKGSTVAVMEALLCEQGISCGAFTSPHLIRYNERIRVNGKSIDDDTIIDAFEAIEAVRGDVTLTYFEFGTLAALWVFRELNVSHQLLEVGLGGRLDAVNIIDADISVITAIGLDHQEWLGPDLDTIAVEKCGIARAGRPCVIADKNAPRAVRAAIQKIGAEPLQSGVDYEFTEAKFWVDRANPIPWQLPSEIISLNAAAAVAALLQAGIRVDESGFSKATQALQLRGRREHMRIGDVSAVLDVAHNVDAAVELHRFIAELPPVNETIAVFAVMSDKNSRDMIAALESDIDFWCLPRGIGGERGEKAEKLAEHLGGNSAMFQDFEEALQMALGRLRGKGRIIIFGSFFTVAEGLRSLQTSQALEIGELSD